MENGRLFNHVIMFVCFFPQECHAVTTGLLILTYISDAQINSFHGTLVGVCWSKFDRRTDLRSKTGMDTALRSKTGMDTALTIRHLHMYCGTSYQYTPGSSPPSTSDGR